MDLCFVDTNFRFVSAAFVSCSLRLPLPSAQGAGTLRLAFSCTDEAFVNGGPSSDRVREGHAARAVIKRVVCNAQRKGVCRNTKSKARSLLVRLRFHHSSILLRMSNRHLRRVVRHLLLSISFPPLFLCSPEKLTSPTSTSILPEIFCPIGTLGIPVVVE